MTTQEIKSALLEGQNFGNEWITETQRVVTYSPMCLRLTNLGA